MASRRTEMELEACRRELEEVKQHRDSWKKLAEDNEKGLLSIKRDVEGSKSRTENDRQTTAKFLEEKQTQLLRTEEKLSQITEQAKALERQLDDTKQQSDIQNASLRNRVAELELNLQAVREREEALTKQTQGLEDLRKQALSDYEREVQQHASKLDALRETRSLLESAKLKASEAESIALNAQRDAVAREAAWNEERKQLANRLSAATNKSRDLEEQLELLNAHMEKQEKAKEARLATLAEGHTSPKRAPGVEEEGGDELRELREHLRRIKNKRDLAEARLLDTEQELARLKQKSEQDCRKLAQLHEQLQVEVARNSMHSANTGQFEVLKEEVKNLYVFKESNDTLRKQVGPFAIPLSCVAAKSLLLWATIFN